MLNVFMLNVFMLSVIMLIVEALFLPLELNHKFCVKFSIFFVEIRDHVNGHADHHARPHGLFVQRRLLLLVQVLLHLHHLATVNNLLILTGCGKLVCLHSQSFNPNR
jgi:hypothetical protein